MSIVNEAVANYIAAWNERDPAKRLSFAVELLITASISQEIEGRGHSR